MLTKPDDIEVVALVLAAEEIAKANDIGVHGLRLTLSATAKMIRQLRPDLAFDANRGNRIGD